MLLIACDTDYGWQSCRCQFSLITLLDEQPLVVRQGEPPKAAANGFQPIESVSICVHLWWVSQSVEGKASQIGKVFLPTIRVTSDERVSSRRIGSRLVFGWVPPLYGGQAVTQRGHKGVG
jgi:hypothetical protein